MFLRRKRWKENIKRLNQSLGPITKTEQNSQKFDLSGNNWVIKDKQFDHLTKINFKKTIKELYMNADSHEAASLYPNILTSSSYMDKSKRNSV